MLLVITCNLVCIPRRALADFPELQGPGALNLPKVKAFEKLKPERVFSANLGDFLTPMRKSFPSATLLSPVAEGLSLDDQRDLQSLVLDSL